MTLFNDSAILHSNHRECARERPADRTATCKSKVLTPNRWEILQIHSPAVGSSGDLFMIRPINEKDKLQYFEMSRMFYASGAALRQIDDEKRVKFWAEILKNNAVNGYILEYGNSVAGYALTVSYPSQEFGGEVLWIDELFVKPEYRGKKLGGEFLDFAANSAKKVLLRLEVEQDNQRAIALYKAKGFEVLPYIQMIKA